MSRPALHEEVDDGAMRGILRSLPADRPADDLQLVVIAAPEHVAARVGKSPNDVQVPRRRRPMHRVRVVTALADIGVYAPLEQQVHGGELPMLRGGVEERPVVRRLAQLEAAGMRIEQGA